jgi:hypothetical protein
MPGLAKGRSMKKCLFKTSPSRPGKWQYHREYEVNYFPRPFRTIKITLAGLRFLCQEVLQIINSGASFG